MFSKSTLVAAAAAALLFVSPVLADANCTRTYTIQAGDICDGISRAQNVSTYQLAAVNYNIIDALCDNLQVGGQLCLGTPGEDCTQIHIVQENDTCDSISSQHGLNSTILMQNNPNIDQYCYNLYEGMALCVASTVVAPPIPPGFFNQTNTGGIDWVPVSPGDDGYDDTLPDCDDVDQ